MVYIKLRCNHETRTAYVDVMNDRISNNYTKYVITDAKKQKSLSLFLQSDKVVYTKYTSDYIGWNGHGQPYLYFMIDVYGERDLNSNFLKGRDESRPRLI